MAGTIPFAIAKTGEPLAALATLPHSLAIAVGTGTTLGVTALAGRRVIRTAAA
ncbi:hypothetical protein [Nocardia salmonicida]|uniref:hypothetical protein n=1 Tax=Nocardia salmonicida TaxID=53431 RepID=UPI002E2971E2|nr:hypothetical protein [Nocardia salmonicida]